jgi:hypothetical protein
MLLPVASAMAAHVVDIAADVNTVTVLRNGVKHKTVTISYIATADVRAFALDINVDGGMNIGDSNLTGFLRGESIAPNKGYGIFPGRFRDFIDPTTPDWGDTNYSPLAPWAAPGAENTGLGWPKIVVELGTLYSGPGDTNKPALSGNLFTFDVNSEGFNDCNLTVAVNALRGGIVGSDANPITDTNLPFNKKVVFAAAPAAPASITYVATHTTGRYTVSWVASVGGADTYQVEQSFNGGAYTQVYTGTGLSFLADAQQGGINVFRVKATNGIGSSGWTTGINSTTTYCYGAAVTGYAQWLLVGRPLGWCTSRQCHGDADGKQEGKSPNIYWVGNADMTILTKAWLKTAAQLYPAPDPNASADFNRKNEGKSPNIVQVGNADMTILSQNWITYAPIFGNPPADCVH